jgi:hypothetical protein
MREHTMSDQEETQEVVESVWTVDYGRTVLDEDCSPNKSCRNMKDVTFDGYAEPGADLAAAWREKLARENKLSTTGESIRDLVLGRGRQT